MADIINNGILYTMLALMCLGGLDRCFGNRLKLGDKFEEGILTAGPLALAIVGVICIAPALGDFLTPILNPIYNLFGASPVMFSGTFLGSDTGGYHLALNMAGDDVAIRNFAGLILGSMLGTTIIFTTPVALGIIRKQDYTFYAKGVLIGLVTIPIGCLVGGIIAGYPIVWMLINLLPVIIFSAFIGLGFIFFQNIMITGFLWFGKFVVAFLTIAFMIAGIQGATDIVIIKNMLPIKDGFEVVGSIVVVLAGAFCLVYLVSKFLSGPLKKIGSLVGMDEVGTIGIIASLANSIAMFVIMKDMDDRSKIINVAFTVSGAYILGDHLGFTAAIEPSMISAVVFGKLAAGVTAVLIAALLIPKENKNNKTEEAVIEEAELETSEN